MTEIEKKYVDSVKYALNNNLYIDAEVKERLSDFFVEHKFKKNNSNVNHILCLLAPKGMGKGEIVRLLCASLSLRLIKIQVGEVSDEEGAVLGHRRSDMNATAGRIIHSLIDLDYNNTVVLLENIDRSDFSGINNSSADFFEILKYMQDHALKNNYLKAPVNFKQIIFIATACNISTIPQGIRESMEIITIPSYTEIEKVKIARDYIIPELSEFYKLKDKVNLSKDALISIIRRYTRESGVAELKKNLTVIFKTISKRIGVRASGHFFKKNISIKNIASYLGPSRYPVYYNIQGDEIGIVTALGKSDRGGCPITLELLAIKGDGKLLFTGNLDKALQESALVAIDYVRSKSKSFGIQDDFYKKHDIHLHILDSSTPKHGVSAGIAIVTALISALTGRPVKKGVSMTGEVSLYGRVFGVRDIRDKVLGAYQIGIKTLFIPKENELDIKSVPREIRRDIKFIFVDTIDEVIKQAIVWGKHKHNIN